MLSAFVNTKIPEKQQIVVSSRNKKKNLNTKMTRKNAIRKFETIPHRECMIAYSLALQR